MADPAPKHLLLVDDDENVVRALTRVFTREGYQITSFTDPLAAWQAVQRNGTVFHLVITDVMMPGMNGRQLAEKICSLKPEQKILFISGQTGGIITEQDVQAHGWYFIKKPAPPADLLTVVALITAA
ncbi:response regulator [Patescibacteria group bacterium]|nr:response regulator [Patescibacteria group bacterium]